MGTAAHCRPVRPQAPNQGRDQAATLRAPLSTHASLNEAGSHLGCWLASAELFEFLDSLWHTAAVLRVAAQRLHLNMVATVSAQPRHRPRAL
jgi:hypothetical protein